MTHHIHIHIHDEDEHRERMKQFASFSDPAGKSLLIKHMGPIQARRVREERTAAVETPTPVKKH
jgi:hypothetical protein